jgi:hypothetical protein
MTKRSKEYRDGWHDATIAILNLLAQLSNRERDAGNDAAFYATNRVWHAVNNKQHEQALKGEP